MFRISKITLFLLFFLSTFLFGCGNKENNKHLDSVDIFSYSSGSSIFSGNMEGLIDYFNTKQSNFLLGITDNSFSCLEEKQTPTENKEESEEYITEGRFFNVEEVCYQNNKEQFTMLSGKLYLEANYNQNKKKLFNFRYIKDNNIDSCGCAGCYCFPLSSCFLEKDNQTIKNNDCYITKYNVLGNMFQYIFNNTFVSIYSFTSNLYADSCEMYQGMVGGLQGNRISFNVVENNELSKKEIIDILSGYSVGYDNENNHNRYDFTYFTDKDKDNFYIEVLSIKYDTPNCDYDGFDNLTKADYNLNPLVYYSRFKIKINNLEPSLVKTGTIMLKTDNIALGKPDLDGIDWVDGLCEVKLEKIRDLGNGFYGYGPYVLVRGLDLTKLIVLSTLHGDKWEESTYIDSSSFEVLEVLDGSEEITIEKESKTTISKKYHIKDNNGEYYVGVSNCGTCARELGDTSAYVIKKFIESQPNIIPQYIAPHNCY